VIKPDWLQYLFGGHIGVFVSEFNVTPYPIDVPDKIDYKQK